MKTHPLYVSLILAITTSAPLALAQSSPKKKPKATPTATQPPSDSGSDASSSSSSSSSSAGSSSGSSTAAASDDEKAVKRPDKAATSAASENVEEPSSYVREKKGERYYFPGLRYRVTVIPQFLVNLFVNQGGTFVSHSIGAELDMRKDDQSTIPWISYTTFGFGDTLFEQKNGTAPAGQASNWSVVNSGLSALFLGLDELWSTKLDEDEHFAFEYGFGVGIGIVFGSLQNNWVYETVTTGPNAGTLVSSDGRHFAQCPSQTPGPGLLQNMGANGPTNGCPTGAHQNATIAKVGGYTEPNWFSGGSVPVLFPHIAFPQLGLRWKPVKQFETRLGLGFSLTGFWFGISGNYGLEKTAPSSSDASPMKETAPEKSDEKKD
jgi:hypothetical protein